MPRLPPLAVLLGFAGLIPFVLLCLGSVSVNVARAQAAALLLVGYGAVVLSFLGAVHWGFALALERGPAERARLVLGVIPALIGWAALAVVVTMRSPSTGLGVLIAGYIATAILETRASRRELVPAGYMLMRWVLTIIVVALLTTVATLRLVGAHALFSF